METPDVPPAVSSSPTTGLGSTELEVQRRAAARGAAAPFIDVPPSPWWLAPAFGAWVGVWIVNFEFGPAVRLVVVVVGLALLATYVRWERSRRGGMPRRMRDAPPEIRQEMVWFCVVAGILALIGLGLRWWSPWAMGGFIGVTFAVWLAIYDKRYAAAAQRVRERLA